VLTTGCITVRVGGDAPPKAAYDVELPQAGWRRLPDVEAARAFRSEASGAVLGLSTACDGAAEEAFDPLLATVTAAVGRRETVEAPAPVAGTQLPSRATTVRGAVDGRPVEMMAVVLKSDTCVYDVTLTGTSLAQSDRDAALRMARSVREKDGA
jgi:hypothetical protein